MLVSGSRDWWSVVPRSFLSDKCPLRQADNVNARRGAGPRVGALTLSVSAQVPTVFRPTCFKAFIVEHESIRGIWIFGFHCDEHEAEDRTAARCGIAIAIERCLHVVALTCDLTTELVRACDAVRLEVEQDHPRLAAVVHPVRPTAAFHAGFFVGPESRHFRFSVVERFADLG